MKIKLTTKEPLVNATYKIPPHYKSTIDEIAEKEGVTQGEVVRGLLEHGLETYNAWGVHRVWGDTMMEHFRKQVKAGDTIIAAGLLGTVTGIDGMFLKVEVAKGVEVKVIKDELTDIMNPSREVLNEMKRFESEMQTFGKRVLKKKK